LTCHYPIIQKFIDPDPDDFKNLLVTSVL